MEGAPVDKQLALLERVFPYISVPELRELPLALLAGLPRVPASYLLTLAQSPTLVAELPVPVRRQVCPDPSPHTQKAACCPPAPDAPAPAPRRRGKA